MKRFRTPLVLLVGVLVCAACARGGDPGSGGASRAVNVRVAPVALRDVSYSVHATGALEADEIVQVTAEVPGRASEVRFETGDRVTPQSVLVRIDPERYRLDAARAEAAHRRALADWERSKADLERREQLDRDRLVAAEELNRVRRETEQRAADTAATKAAFEIAQQNVERAAVRAPRAGEIASRSVDTGQFVQAGTVLATLVDTRRLRLRFRVSESESLKVREGQPVAFTVAALGKRAFTADIYHVADLADPATRQVEVLGWVKNTGELKPGFFAEVLLTTEVRPGAVVVPEGAVQASDRGFVSYVVDGTRVHQRTVQLGLRTGDGAVEIMSGLKGGETVVVEGSDRLADGVEIKAVATGAAGGQS